VISPRVYYVAYKTIVLKEITRFTRIWLQTVLPPHEDVIGQWSDKEGKKATGAAAALFRKEGIAHQVHFSVGDAALEVRSLAEETRAELVVLGTRGLGAAHHALVGSVALKAAVASPVPVLLVP